MAKNYSVFFGTGDPRGFTGLSPTFIQFWNLSTGTTNAPPSISETVSGKTGAYTFTYGVTQPIQFLIDAATTIAGRYVTGQIDPADRIDEVGTTLTAIGYSGLVYGSSLISLGNTAVALGTTTVAIGTSHIAQGVSLTAQGVSILAFGVSLTAQNVTLTAIGFSSLVYGTSLFALGTTGVALGTSTIALLGNFGSTLTGIGNSSLALGNFIGSTASSFGSTSVDPVDLFGFMKRAQEIAEGNQVYTKSTGLLDFYSRGSSTLLREKTISDTSSQTSKT